MQSAKSDQQQIHLVTHSKDAPKRPQIKGKFFYVGDEKLLIRGVTYGTFRPDDSGNEFHNPEVVEKDFTHMAAIGINVVRIYTPPPDVASGHSITKRAVRYGRVAMGTTCYLFGIQENSPKH